MQGNKLIVGYWPLRGVVERIRILLEFTGLKYEMVIYDENKDDPWFKVDKPRLIEKNPALTLPYLLDGEKLITESTAIIIYICYKAQRVDLLGRNPDEHVLLMTAYGVYQDFYPQIIKLVYGPFTKNWEDSLKDFWQESTVYLKKLSGLLGTKNYLCGEMTWIDFVLADTFQVLRLMNPSVFDDFKNLKELQERIWGLSELKDYFANRFQEHPVNGEEARWR